MNSIHDDLFPTNHNAAQSELQYDGHSSKINSSRRHSTLTSLNSKDQAAMNASWKMKILVLLCMLSLPGKLIEKFNFIAKYLIYLFDAVGCHYLEATLGTLKTTLKSVSYFIFFCATKKNCRIN